MRHSRSPFLLVCCALAMVSTVTLVGAGLAVRPPARPAARTASAVGSFVPVANPDAIEATARRFYAAANAVIRTGDAAELDGVLTAGFVVPGVGVQADTGRSPLAASLTALGGRAGGAGLSVDEVLVAGDRAVVRIRLTGAADGPFDGLALDDPSAILATVAVLRIAGDRVAEYRPVAATAPQVRLLGHLNEVAPDAAQIGLVRITLEPGAHVPAVVNPGPALLVVESGRLTVRLGTRDPIDALLNGGDAFALPVGVPYAVVNAGLEPVAAVAVALFPAPIADTLHDGERPDGGAMRARALLLPHAAGAMGTIQGLPRVRVTRLAGGGIAPSAGAVRLTLARVALDPGQALPAHRAPGPELVVVESGVAAVAGDPPRANPTRVGAGAGMVLAPGPIGPIANDGGEPLTLLVVAVGPG